MAEAGKTGGDNARTELGRLSRAGDMLGGSVGAGDAREAGGDGIEVWGRRIGRVLGWAFAVFLLVQLLRTYAG